jgi:glutamate--cysteine ligase
MSTKEVSDRVDPVITTREQLIAPMAGGEKPRERWRIGTEHEKFVYRTADHRAPSYDEPDGIRDMLVSLGQFGWEPILRAATSLL